MIHKLSVQELLELTSKDIPYISEHDKDEMAIPSYLHKNPFIRWLIWKRYEYILSLSKFSKDKTVLEFGCGIGVFLPELDKSCGKVYAIDIFPEYAKLLSTKLNLNIHFIENLSEISNNSLDIIIVADVLEHVAGLDEYLAMFSKKLKDNGRLVISGPTENIFYKAGRTLAGFGKKGDYHHTNINKLNRIIGEAGFYLVRLKTLPFMFPLYLFKVCEFKKCLTDHSIGAKQTMACPACFSQQFKENGLISDASVKISVRRCLRCGLLLSDIKRTKPTEAEFARIDDIAYHRAISAVRQRQAGEILSFIKQHNPKGKNWLDIGCSFGVFLYEVKQARFNVYGIEIDEKAFKHAQQLLGDDHVYHGLMVDDLVPDNSIGVISTLDVLEHIPVNKLSEFARIIRQKLVPKGLWLIKVPTTEGLYFTIAHWLRRLKGIFLPGAVKRLWQSEYQFPHTVYFNKRSLKRYLENHGFEVVGFRYIEEVPNKTVIDRLRIDNTIPNWLAFLIAPAFYFINFVEKCRSKSDGLLILAQTTNR